jgi:hypothetical protein
MARVNAEFGESAAERRRALKRFTKAGKKRSDRPMVSLTPAPQPRKNPEPSLNLPLDKVSFIILKAREYDVKEEDADPDSGSNPIDDGQTDVLANKQEDPVREELLGAIRSLNEEERLRLVALAWLGRGTYGKEEWREAVATARSEHSRRTAEYLLGLPLLGDYLEDGLALFDEGIVDNSDTREGLDGEDEPLDGMRDKPQRQ